MKYRSISDVFLLNPHYSGKINQRGHIYCYYRGIEHSLDGPAYSLQGFGTWWINGNRVINQDILVRLNEIMQS